jgi:hypothetical protein
MTLQRSRGFCFAAETQYLRVIIWCVSAATFVICAFILLSGLCVEAQGKNERIEHHWSQLEFISTQMAACLQTHIMVTYLFVLGMSVQMLLLLDGFLRFIATADSRENNYQLCKCFYFKRQTLVLIYGVLTLNFVINIAAVAEFRSDATFNSEKILHYSSAVCTMVLFWAIHFLISLYLRAFAHTTDPKYTKIRNWYLALTVFFFVLWVFQIVFVVLDEVAKVVEWLILLVGLIMQCYAEYTLYVHTPKYVQNIHFQDNINLQRQFVIKAMMFSFLYCVLTYIIFTKPFFMESIVKEPYTGVEFWCVLIVTTLVVTLQLFFATIRQTNN